MSTSMPTTKSRSSEQGDSVTSVTVRGYKSIAAEQTIEVRPLTVLAGANSSGKSSIIQPLLLLKQTLEASYDPGALLLDGPNVRFTSVDQLMSRCGHDGNGHCFSVGIGIGSSADLSLLFEKVPGKGLGVKEMTYGGPKQKVVLREGMTQEQIAGIIPKSLRGLAEALAKGGESRAEWAVIRDRFFLALVIRSEGKRIAAHLPFGSQFPFGINPGGRVDPQVRGIIHLPGLRGNPRRSYPKTAVGSTFPGVFQDYTASVIARWQESDKAKLRLLGKDLERLGLTWKVAAKHIDDTQVELQVGRLTHASVGGGWDLVNIADVGFGVSQALPVVVALHVAEPGQLVYLEQPEIHLHPKAQDALAQVLADAAARGVRVVAETHSALLLLGIQSLVARGKLAPTLVKLHWFRRQADGCTEVKSADLDADGSFGDWPEDFGDTELNAEKRYLDAAADTNMGGGIAERG